MLDLTKYGMLHGCLQDAEVSQPFEGPFARFYIQAFHERCPKGIGGKPDTFVPHKVQCFQDCRLC